MFLPGNASSLLNPVKQEALRRPARGTTGESRVWVRAKARRPLAPWAPPGWSAGPWGQGQGQSRGGAAPADGNYDFRKLECCLGNINAHSSPGGTPKTEPVHTRPAPSHMSTNTDTCVCTYAHAHTSINSCTHTHVRVQTHRTHTRARRYTCICTCAHTTVHNTHTGTHTRTRPCRASDSQP